MKMKQRCRKLRAPLLSAFLVLLLLCTCLLTGCDATAAAVPSGSSVTDDNSVTDGNSVTDDNAASDDDNVSDDSSASAPAAEISEDGTYTDKEQVALYLYTYGHLPDNFITKKAAKKLGWVSREGNLAQVAPGKSIGGDYFGNYEEQLPTQKGRSYHECDIDADGGYRGAKRIIYSDDGLIYYTEDHYKTFTLLYGEEE